MRDILRFSEAASLAFHAMFYLARTPLEHQNVGHIAGLLQCSEAHLSKVMQRLQRAGLVSSTRGPKGGYRLELPADTITLLHVYEAVDGPLAKTKCLLETSVCQADSCILGDLMERVGRQVHDYLSHTSLSALSTAHDANQARANCGQRGNCGHRTLWTQ